jgi:hypothetical protein
MIRMRAETGHLLVIPRFAPVSIAQDQSQRNSSPPAEWLAVPRSLACSTPALGHGGAGTPSGQVRHEPGLRDI